MVQLSREETFLLLTCRPDLTPSDDVRLQRIVDSDLDWSFVLWRAESYQTLPLCGFHLNRLALLPGHQNGSSTTYICGRSCRRRGARYNSVALVNF